MKRCPSCTASTRSASPAAPRPHNAPPGWLRPDLRGIHFWSSQQMIENCFRYEFEAVFPNALGFSVMGADVVNRYGSHHLMASMPSVVVGRDNEMEIFRQKIAYWRITRGQHSYLLEASSETGDFSSTKVRKALDTKSQTEVRRLCSRQVAEYLLETDLRIYTRWPTPAA